MNSDKFLKACKDVALNPYMNGDDKLRRYASLSELLTESSLLINGNLTNAKEEQSNYFIGKSISTRAIINSFIRESVDDGKTPFKHAKRVLLIETEASFYVCKSNWFIIGLERILQDTTDRFTLINIKVVEQPYHDNTQYAISLDITEFLLNLGGLKGIVDSGKFYFFLFTLEDKVTNEILTFAYPIDFKEKKK